ncbi:FAD binding domain-containing protein [Xylariaceae sp. FL1272]|nr:FAD binding domain-containing protein [Xylariaceae sp. FL1272]
MAKNIDCLVIGNGPTGMTLALELVAQGGITFRIIDKATTRSPYSRALVMQPRTLELLRRHGPVDDLIDAGTTADGVTMCVLGKKVVDINSTDIPLPGTQFPQLVVSQCETEKWLEKTLRLKHGVRVEMGTQAKTITQDAEGVTVVTSREDGSEEVIRAKFVIGADGAHSAVRHAAKNLTFDGDVYRQEFILADCHLKSDHPPNRAYMCLGQGVMVVIPMSRNGLVRLVVSRPGQDDSRDPKLEDFEEFLQGIFPGGGSLHDPTWITRFRLHHRGVNKYRDGRLFVAGDAAHIHSPAGGQGMNTGIQDSINLGWKLGAVLRNEKPDSFLDSYHDERHPVGQHLLNNTDKSFTYVTTSNPILLFLRNLLLPWVLPLVTKDKSRVRNMFMFQSQLKIRYRHSNIVGTAVGFSGPLQGGNRAPDAKIKSTDGEKWLLDLLTPQHHHLLLFSGIDSGASEGDLHRAEETFVDHARGTAKVHMIFSKGHSEQGGYIDVDDELHQSFGFKNAGYALVRPDCYLAHIGPLSAVAEAAKWL